MDTREELYKELRAQLLQVEGVKHVDLWNQQTDFLEEETAFEMPAIFIELGDIEWNVMKGFFRGWGEVRIHTVIPWSSEAPIEAWHLTDSIWTALFRIQGEGFDSLYPCMTIPNRSHGEIFENIDVFRVKYRKDWVTE